jgi:hypothetical protein
MAELDLHSARQRLSEIIARGELIAEGPQQGQAAAGQLGPITQQFFSEYASVQTARGGLVIAASEIARSEYVAGFVSIGHSEDWDIVQMPGTDEVRIVEGSEQNEEEMDIRFPTVYHLLVHEANA